MEGKWIPVLLVTEGEDGTAMFTGFVPQSTLGEWCRGAPSLRIWVPNDAKEILRKEERMMTDVWADLEDFPVPLFGVPRPGR